LPGRVKSGGTEEEILVAHGCRKTKKLICGTEDEIVVVHGRLPAACLPPLARKGNTPSTIINSLQLGIDTYRVNFA